MAGRRICILIATIDAICVSIISDMLRSCTYEVIHMGMPIDVLMAICERKDIIGVVLTNIHRIQAQVADDILYHIQKKLRLQACLMPPHDRKIELERHDGAFVAYIVHSLDDGVDHHSFWRMSGIRSSEVYKFADISSHIMTSTSLSLASTLASASTSHTAVSVDGDQESKKGSNRKSRVVWTEEMDRKFLKAKYTLDPKDVVPKKILEHMGVSGQLKLQHVASHLQKHRLRGGKRTAKVSEPMMSTLNRGSYMGLSLPKVLAYRVTALTREVHDAVNQTPTTVEDVPAPVQGAPAPVQGAPAPVQGVQGAPAPVQGAPAQNESTTSQQPAPNQTEADEDIGSLIDSFWNQSSSFD